jgi:hypothetical protein
VVAGRVKLSSDNNFFHPFGNYFLKFSQGTVQQYNSSTLTLIDSVRVNSDLLGTVTPLEFLGALNDSICLISSGHWGGGIRGSGAIFPVVVRKSGLTILQNSYSWTNGSGAGHYWATSAVGFFGSKVALTGYIYRSGFGGYTYTYTVVDFAESVSQPLAFSLTQNSQLILEVTNCVIDGQISFGYSRNSEGSSIHAFDLVNAYAGTSGNVLGEYFDSAFANDFVIKTIIDTASHLLIVAGNKMISCYSYEKTNTGIRGMRNRQANNKISIVHTAEGVVFNYHALNPVQIEILNLKGISIFKTIVPAGKNVSWNKKDCNGNLVSTGIYCYRISSRDRKPVRGSLLLTR